MYLNIVVNIQKDDIINLKIFFMKLLHIIPILIQDFKVANYKIVLNLIEFYDNRLTAYYL